MTKLAQATFGILIHSINDRGPRVALLHFCECAFGDDFANSLRNAPQGKWSGPVRSGFGWHAVRVRNVIAAGTPTLSAVRQRVSNDWRAETQKKREAAAYQALLDGYDIRIAKP